MKFAVLLLTTTTTSGFGWNFRKAFSNTPLGHFRINGNELVDLIPEAFTSRIEQAVNLVNEM
jgi:hypothetical protein